MDRNNPAAGQAASLEEAARLSARMLKKRLFVALRHCRQPDRVTEKLAEHLAWMMSAERRGLVFASGPFVVPGAPPGTAGSLTILRASTFAEAEVILAEDPFIAAGVFGFELKEWSLMEGSFSVTVNYSDQTYRVY